MTASQLVHNEKSGTKIHYQFSKKFRKQKFDRVEGDDSLIFCDTLWGLRLSLKIIFKGLKVYKNSCKTENWFDKY